MGFLVQETLGGKKKLFQFTNTQYFKTTVKYIFFVLQVSVNTKESLLQLTHLNPQLVKVQGLNDDKIGTVHRHFQHVTDSCVKRTFCLPTELKEALVPETTTQEGEI